jgi:hypothetical protein
MSRFDWLCYGARLAFVGWMVVGTVALFIGLVRLP